MYVLCSFKKLLLLYIQKLNQVYKNVRYNKTIILEKVSITNIQKLTLENNLTL